MFQFYNLVASLTAYENVALAGYAAAVAFMNSFSTDQFPIGVTVRWFVFADATAAMFVVAGLSLLPAPQAVKRIDVGAVVRERSA